MLLDSKDMTIKDVLATSEVARNEIEIILAHLMQKDRSFLVSHSEDELGEEILVNLKSLLERRTKNEPTQYLLKKADFFGLEFYVDKRVLIPRPETEALVGQALSHILRVPARDSGVLFHPFPQTYKVLDVGTGSGNIAISLAKHLPHVEIVAVDISPEALEVAKINAQKHALTDRISFRQSDLLGAFLTEGSSFDLIVANLPYISENFYQVLEPHIREYEPKIALVGGPTGLEQYSALFRQAPLVLKKGGIILYELDGQCLEFRI